MRHPLYGTFIIGYVGWAVSVHSLYGVIAAVVLGLAAVVNACAEERRLADQFGEEHVLYKQTGPPLLFHWYGWVLIVLPLLAAACGRFLSLAQ